LAAIFLFSFYPAITEATPSIKLAWNANPSQDVVGYVLYYGAVTGTYTNANDAGPTTNAVVSGLIDGVTYFFALTAYNALGLESDFSAESFVEPPDADKCSPNSSRRLPTPSTTRWEARLAHE
jgi:hypothetical protein